MSNLESTPSQSDRIQQQTGSDQTTAPLVNMANPNEVQATFNTSQGERGTAVSADGQMIFSNPYGSAESSDHGDNWHHDGEHHNGHHGHKDSSTENGGAESSATLAGNDVAGANPATQAGSDTGASAGASGTDAGIGTAASGSGETPAQQLETQIASLKADIAQLTAEVTQLFGNSASGAASSDSGTAAGAAPSDIGTVASTAPSDTGTVASTAPSDSGTVASTAPSDTGTVASTAPSDSGTIASTNPGTTADTTGLSVQGDQLLDNGKPFVAVGINDTTSTEHNELTDSMPAIAAEGANTVRIMGQASDLTGGTDNPFHQEVQAALNAGLKVDLSLNSDTAIYGQTGGVLSSSDVAEATNALYTAAAQYGNNPNVMYNVMNEQGASGDANNPTLLANTEALEQAVVQGAQSTNPGAKPVIVVDDSEWGQGGYDGNYQSASFLYNNAAALEQAGSGNVVGAVHNYDSGSSYTNDGITAIQQEGMPVIAEEVGYNPSSFSLSEQVQSTTGEPVGGLVWVDGNDPQSGAFYNNVLADQNTAPAVQQFWQTVNSEAASAAAVTA